MKNSNTINNNSSVINSSVIKMDLKYNILASVCASSLAEAITSPIDMIKTHMQANVMEKRATPFKSTVSGIYQKHGLAGFYQSWIPSMARQASNTGIRMGLYSYFQDNLELDKKVKGGNIMMGAGCGLIANILSMPMDVIKVRIQSAQGTSSSSAFLPMAKTIMRERGLSGFYRGFNQTAQRSIAISSVQLPVYFGIQEKLKESEMDLNLRTGIAAVATTGIVTSVVYPVDLCKTLVQSDVKIKKGTLNLMTSMYRDNGLKILYRGYWMGLGRALPHFLCTSILYENFKKALSD